MWLLTVSKTLKSYQVKYAIAGGFAVALHGVVRGTVDIDVVVATDEVNLSRLEQAMKDLGLVSRIPVTAKEMANFKNEYIQNRNLIAWSFVDPKNPSHIVDAIIAHPFSSRDVVSISVHGTKLPVLSRRALISMKLKSGRPQDIEDARALGAIDEKS